MAFFFRFLSFLALVLAIAAGTIDAIASVASSSVVLTSVEEDWLAASPRSLPLVQGMVEHYIHPQVWQNGFAVIIRQPAFAVCLGLSLALWMIGYRRPPPRSLFA